MSTATTSKKKAVPQTSDGQEIRKKSKGRHSLDDVARGLMRLDEVSTDDLVEITEALLGEPSDVLDTRLLR